MRALILAAGTGSRLGALTSRRNKCLLDCRGRPIVDLVASSAAQIPEITEVVMVVGYRANEVVQHFQEHPIGRPLTFVHQSEQRGLVDAIDCARPWVDDDEVLLLLGDEVLLGGRYQEFINDFHDQGFQASIGALPTNDLDRISKTYTFSYSGRQVRRLVEKPSVALSPQMGTGSVLFSAGILSHSDLTKPNPARSEKDLAGVLQTIVDHGHPVGWFDVCEGFVNVNTPDDLKDARQLAKSGL